MSKNVLIEFEYRTKDGVIQPRDCKAIMFSDDIIINGERTQVVFDPERKKPVKMTGLYITYKNIQYGSLTITLAVLLAILQACLCVEDEFRIFDDVFDLEFE